MQDLTKFLPDISLPEWWPVVIVVIAVAAIAGKKKSKKKSKPKSRLWMYIDDVVTEGNGPQDLMCVLGLSRLYGHPILIGATNSKHGTGVGFTRQVSRLENGPLVFEGARRYGSNQGHSPLSKEIVKYAQKGSLTVCVGGKWTDVAIALRRSPEIAGNLNVVAIGGSNKKNDPDATNAVVKSGCRLTVLERGDYSKLITAKSADDGAAWLRTHIGRKKAGSKVLTDTWWKENIRNNAGQFGNPTPLRMADCLSVLVAFEGWDILKNPNKCFSLIEKGLSKLP